MNLQLFFHLSFIVVFLGFTLIRAVYHRRATKLQGQTEYKEGGRHVFLRKLFGLPFITAILAYMVYPPVLAFAHFETPVWVQWAGLISGVASLGLIWWVQWALDVNFSTVLHIRDEHTLVTHGPYRWVRHPMYTVLYLNGLAALLLTQNWLIGGAYLLSLSLIVVSRLQNEETAMQEKFGNDYVEYMKRTGRFLPRLTA